MCGFAISGIEGEEDLFALRRFKLMVGGNLTPRVQWYAQVLYKDGNRSPTDGRVYFQEAWLRFAYRREIQFVAGQFKPVLRRSCVRRSSGLHLQPVLVMHPYKNWRRFDSEPGENIVAWWAGRDFILG